MWEKYFIEQYRGTRRLKATPSLTYIATCTLGDFDYIRPSGIGISYDSSLKQLVLVIHVKLKFALFYLWNFKFVL